MAIVHLPATLRGLTGGAQEISVDAPRVIELKAELGSRFPGIRPELDRMAVALDGQIHTDADFELLQATTEIYFVPRVSGGQDRSGALERLSPDDDVRLDSHAPGRIK